MKFVNPSNRVNRGGMVIRMFCSEKAMDIGRGFSQVFDIQRKHGTKMKINGWKLMDPFLKTEYSIIY